METISIICYNYLTYEGSVKEKTKILLLIAVSGWNLRQFVVLSRWQHYLASVRDMSVRTRVRRRRCNVSNVNVAVMPAFVTAIVTFKSRLPNECDTHLQTHDVRIILVGVRGMRSGWGMY